MIRIRKEHKKKISKTMKKTLNNSPENRNNSHRDYELIKILIALFLPYLALSVAQNGFLGLLPFVREEFALSRVQVGYYSTFFFISASFLSVFSGSIVDSFGPKKSILFGIISLGILLLLQGLSPLYNLILLLSFLSGLGFSIITPSATKAVIHATSQEKRAFSMGFTQSGFGLGGILGASILPFLGERIGWRVAVQIAALMVLFTGYSVYKLYHDGENRNKTIDTTTAAMEEKKYSFSERLSSIIANKPLFRICFSGILFGISEGALLSHFVVFLTEDIMISKVAAGLSFATLHMGGMVGLIMWGFFSDRFFRADRRIGIFLIGLSSGIMYLFFGLFVFRPFQNQALIFIFSFLFGFLVLGWTGAYLTTVGEIAGDGQAGIATGLTLLFVRGAMIIAPPIFGLIADINGSYRYSWLIYSFIIIGMSFLFLPKKSPKLPIRD